MQNFVSVPAPVFRRDAWLSCGGMDQQLWYTPDWDIWLKLAAAGPVVYHDDFTTAFRVHRSSLTIAGSRDGHEFRSQMEIVLDRHLGRSPTSIRKRVERAARASINVNVSLRGCVRRRPEDASSSNWGCAVARSVGDRRYLRDSRLWERLIPGSGQRSPELSEAEFEPGCPGVGACS